MKVFKVKSRRERERIERRVLKNRKVVAVVNDVRDLNSDFVKRADVVVVDESFGREGFSTPN
ncbi:hypothetical protein [Hydrogenivirga sp. 128-5-R1-1]|uniref:hypothetical protein n=1 Tax=Hydrogenivirga sp. 128-5-R1-1 TaxID=392423 RepID=UPI00015F0D3B|nr:hypothetical protein [Hydrogenivirga sp. 128-5-R1-1]EDP75993.1 hypothetical protein HG1285_06690 [Hydrogenivirga sp. 128-5-R1-1]